MSKWILPVVGVMTMFICVNLLADKLEFDLLYRLILLFAFFGVGFWAVGVAGLDKNND